MSDKKLQCLQIKVTILELATLLSFKIIAGPFGPALMVSLKLVSYYLIL